jgi:hypothetical protein
MSGAQVGRGDPDELVTVARFIDPVAAEFARSRLEADGLTCFIQGIGLGSLLPTATVFPILLQVRAADAARAIEILAERPAADILAEDQEPAAPAASGGEPEP